MSLGMTHFSSKPMEFRLLILKYMFNIPRPPIYHSLLCKVFACGSCPYRLRFVGPQVVCKPSRTWFKSGSCNAAILCWWRIWSLSHSTSCLFVETCKKKKRANEATPWNSTKLDRLIHLPDLFRIPFGALVNPQGNAHAFMVPELAAQVWNLRRSGAKVPNQNRAAKGKYQRENTYIGGICWYISRVLSHGYPTFPIENRGSTKFWL